MHSEWTQNLHTFINPVNTRTPTSKLPTRGGHSLVTLSSMLLTRQKRPKPLSKQKKEGFRRNPRKGPPLGNPYIYWKNQPFSLDIKAITSQWNVPEKRSVCPGIFPAGYSSGSFRYSTHISFSCLRALS